jgi:hypothetical protein
MSEDAGYSRINGYELLGLLVVCDMFDLLLLLMWTVLTVPAAVCIALALALALALPTDL